MIKSLIWVENDEIKKKVEELINEKLTSTFFVSEFKDTSFKMVRKILKKKDAQRIIKFSTDMSRFDIYYKYNSVWTKITFENLVQFWMNSKKLSAVSKWNTPDQFKLGNEKIEINFPLNFSEISRANEILNFYMDAKEELDIFSNKTKDAFNSNEYFTFKFSKEDDFEKFVKNYKKSKDLDNAVIEKNEENKFVLKTSKGKIYIEKIGDEASVLLSFKNNYSADLFYYTRGIRNNIKALINNETKVVGEKKKFDLKNILLISLSIIVILALLVVTFKFIYNPENSKTATEILFSNYTWNHPWIYLMIVNFIISLFLGLILSIVLQWFTPGSGKVNYKSALNMWVGIQIRMVTVFITGNAFLGTFIWGLYVVKTTKARTIGFAGMVASINILRGIIMIPIGFLFMTRATFYEANILNAIGKSSEFATFTTLSWIGWVWSIIHHMSLSLLIILPPLHILTNRIQEVYFDRKRTFEQVTDKMHVFEMQITSLKKSFGSMFKNKKRITRTTMMIVFAIVIETFEFTYSLRMVEDYGINVVKVDGLTKANYYNILALSSVRYSANFIHTVPIINLMPGQGLGITDFALNDTTTAIIADKHNDLFNTNVDVINKMSDETTLIIRFFNFFLKKLVGLIITICFLIKYFFFKKLKKD